MPTPTYTPLANLTLSSSASTVTFSSINQGFRDLVLVVNAQMVSGSAQALYRFNGDTAGNYNYVFAQGDGTITTTAAWANETKIYAQTYVSESNTTRSNAIINVMDYSATNKHKSVLIRTNGSSIVALTTGRWASTAAVTTLTTSLSANSWAAGSTFALYGIVS